jgi:hypothetical protein
MLLRNQIATTYPGCTILNGLNSAGLRRVLESVLRSS